MQAATDWRRLVCASRRLASKVFYAPVDDFELSVTTLEDGGSHPLPGRGPRVVLCLEGLVALRTAGGTLTLARGQSAFLTADDGPLTAVGSGTLVQADVP